MDDSSDARHGIIHLSIVVSVLDGVGCSDPAVQAGSGISLVVADNAPVRVT